MATGDTLPKITLDYSLDNGANFTGSPVEFTFEIARAWLNPDIQDMDVLQSGRKEQIKHPYLKVEMQSTSLEVDPATASSAAVANANWLFFQNWLCAPIMRMVYDTTNFASMGGYTQFASGTNTNYVRLISFEPDFVPSVWDDSLGQPSKRRMRIVVETRDRITLT